MFLLFISIRAVTVATVFIPAISMWSIWSTFYCVLKVEVLKQNYVKYIDGVQEAQELSIRLCENPQQQSSSSTSDSQVSYYLLLTTSCEYGTHTSPYPDTLIMSHFPLELMVDIMFKRC